MICDCIFYILEYLLYHVAFVISVIMYSFGLACLIHFIKGCHAEGQKL